MAILWTIHSAAAKDSLPNVLLILADDIAYTDYGFMGHPKIQTPHLDRLAKTGLTFKHGHVPTSLCRPSLMSLITGMYPHEHLITGNDPPKGTPREAMLQHIDRCPTVPKRLLEKDYLSYQAGKWWEGKYSRGGFTHGMTHGDPKQGGRHGDEGLKTGRQGVQSVIDFIDQAGDKPFFVWYAPMLPHQPHNPPERLLEKYRPLTPSLHVAKYWAMVEWFDETCGALLNHLEQKKLSENTLVLYVADNGWIQNPEKPSYDLRSKRSIMLRWPAKIAPRMDETTLVSSIDLAPTILAAANLAASPEMKGVNLLPLAIDKIPVPRDTLYGAIFEHDIPDIQASAPGLQFRWCLEGRWKWIKPAGDGPGELFDVQADPTEMKNLAQEQPERATHLQAKLDTWWKP
jgi:arylsulfatase A-like enzyme